MSVRIFYGPKGHEEAISYAHRNGRLLGDVEALKIQAVREGLGLMGAAPIGDVGTGYVVFGPMDLAPFQCSDAMLKTVEEPEEEVQPILWANDIADVSPTIRSRCLAEYAQGDEVEINEDGLELFKAVFDRPYQIPEIIERNKNNLHDLVGGLALAVSVEGSERAYKLWDRVKTVSRYRNMTSLELFACLLGGD